MQHAHRGLVGLGFAVAAASGLAQSTFIPVLKAPAAASAASEPAPLLRITSHRIAFVGSMGRQALLVIDGAAPRALTVGATVQGVRLISVAEGLAVIELEGRRQTLRLGAAAVNLGGAPSPGSGSEIRLSSDANGHFQANGQINGRGVSFLVDTGATLIAIGRSEADRIGLRYQDGARVTVRTANGDAVGHRIALGSVRVGDVEVFNVDAVVQPADLPYILLGNSFLTRFQMRRDNDTLTLQRRY